MTEQHARLIGAEVSTFGEYVHPSPWWPVLLLALYIGCGAWLVAVVGGMA